MREAPATEIRNNRIWRSRGMIGLCGMEVIARLSQDGIPQEGWRSEVSERGRGNGGGEAAVAVGCDDHACREGSAVVHAGER